ncbi:4-hydroxyphenylacetate 3-hydroxylase [Pseudonocardia sp. CNS-139]|nr:4-hydroxyphenylacetate 3-hydroxylase [Pseudonocardia sp. CNS-139]
MTRTGADYLAAIRDDRTVYLDGEPVADVAGHPAFAPIAATVAQLYDVAADPASGMAHTDPVTGIGTLRPFSAPRSAADLAAFHDAARTWARHTHGWVGRSPDHVGAFVAGFGAHPEAFDTADHALGDSVRALHARVQRDQPYVAYAIIPPQVTRATTAHAWGSELVQVGVVAEKGDGIVVRGAQMLATGAAVADEVLVSCIKPLTPDDRDVAVSFVLPVATPGLALHCRRPYAPAATSGYDYPLTTRYDETDAFVVCDDVFVPWERVLVCRDVDGVRRQFFETGAHQLGNFQAQTRFAVKLRFLAGLARKIAQVNGIDRIPSVAERLGELAALCAGVESGVLAALHTAAPDAAGVFLPGARALYGSMGLQAETYPRVLGIVRELAGGGVLQVPSGVADLRSPLTRPALDRYVFSPGTPAEERIKLFKLVWDAVGSEFGSRHHQYEMFYAGAPFVAKGYAMRHFDYDGAVAEVEEFLAGYSATD